MKKTLAVAGLGAALLATPMVAAGAASAYPGSDLDAQYVACVAQDGLFSHGGPSMQAAYGRQIANHISWGWRDPVQERDWVYNDTPAVIGVTDANWLVNCATQVYLGFGPWDSSGGGTLA